MDFDNDLEASVWGETGEQNPFDELSKTFANFSADKGKTTENQSSDNPLTTSEWAEPKHQSNFDDEEPVGIAKLSLSEPILSHDNDKSELLGSLAPEEDPLQELTQTTLLNSPAKNDPLFNEIGKSPISFSADPLQISSAPLPNSPKARRSGKLNKLFSSARARRNPIQKDANQKENGINDPLVEKLSQKERDEKFVDESLEDSEIEDGKLTLERQMEAPLFKLSFKKSHVPETSTISTGNSAAIDRFDISVIDPMKVGDITAVYVEYTIVSKSNSFERDEYRVKRRYRDFRWLYRQLQHNNWGRIIPPPPEKQAVGRFKQDFIENRRAQMERMLQHIGNNAVLQKDEDFILFLTSEKWAQDSKLREQLTGSKASRDSNDISDIHISELKLLGAEDGERVIKNGGLDTEGQGGFMGLSFGPALKYKEPDEFFLEKAHEADVLEEQFKQLYKALELVDSQRADLCSVINEFSGTIQSLAELEISNHTSTLLNNFADVQQRVKESTSRCSMQDSLTLGVSIDDHLRTIGSVKAILNQRNKLGYYLLIVENDVNKKQLQLNKASFRNSS